MQPVWQAQAAALTGKLVSPREGGSRGRDPTGRLGRECRAGCTVLSSGALGTSIPGLAPRRRPQDWHPGGAPRTPVPPGQASGRGPQDHCTPGTGTHEGPPGPLRLQDGHLGGAPRTTMPLGQAPRRGPQDHCTPGTTVPLGRAFGRGPQDHCAPGMDIWERPPGPLHPRDYRAPSEAESCPGGCLSPPAQALVLTQLLCSSSELTEATS